jgi:hypothetical protein
MLVATLLTASRTPEIPLLTFRDIVTALTVLANGAALCWRYHEVTLIFGNPSPEQLFSATMLWTAIEHTAVR